MEEEAEEPAEMDHLDSLVCKEIANLSHRMLRIL